MPENVGWVQRRAGTRQNAGCCFIEGDFVVVHEDAFQATILSAYQSRPFYVSPSQILN